MIPVAWTDAQGIEWALDCALGDSGPSNETSTAAVECGAAEWDHDGSDGGGCAAFWTDAFSAYAEQMEVV